MQLQNVKPGFLVVLFYKIDQKIVMDIAYRSDVGLFGRQVICRIEDLRAESYWSNHPNETEDGDALFEQFINDDMLRQLIKIWVNRHGSFKDWLASIWPYIATDEKTRLLEIYSEETSDLP